MPLPPTLPAAPEEGPQRPAWLTGAPPLAIAAWALADALAPGSSLTQRAIVEAIDGARDDGPQYGLRVEVSSTLRAAGLVCKITTPVDGGPPEVLWQRPPWRAPAPCRKCGRVA